MNVLSRARRLQKEIEELREAIGVLQAKLHEAEEALLRLRKARSTLEHDIQTKERSLDIDSKVCLGLRKRMATEPKSCPTGHGVRNLQA